MGSTNVPPSLRSGSWSYATLCGIPYLGIMHSNSVNSCAGWDSESRKGKFMLAIVISPCANVLLALKRWNCSWIATNYFIHPLEEEYHSRDLASAIAFSRFLRATLIAILPYPWVFGQEVTFYVLRNDSCYSSFIFQPPWSRTLKTKSGDTFSGMCCLILASASVNNVFPPLLGPSHPQPGSAGT